jgi:hypothetical protein
MATNMKLRRFPRLILTLALACANVAPSRAGDWMPLLPDQNFYDFQLFAPPDLQDYEIYPEPSEGIFFNYDRLYWGITPPGVRKVAEAPNGNYLIPYQPVSPQAIVQLNNSALSAALASGTTGSSIGGLYIFGSDPLQLDLNTSWMRTSMAWGNRYEGGWIYDGRGMAIDYFNIGQSQEFQTNSEFAAASPTQTFASQSVSAGGGSAGGGFGNTANALQTNYTITTSPPPDHLIAQKLTQKNQVEISSAGAVAIIRRELGRRGSGGTVRFGLGPRYLQFAESYKLGYESNQYAFNTSTNTGVGAGGQTGGQAGGQTGGTGAQTGGIGGQTGGIGGQTGGIGGTTSQFGGGSTALSIYDTSAGDVLGITGYDTLTGLGQSTPLQVADWETNTYNNIVGPEFSLLFETQQGRWSFSSAFKFTAGFNWQNNLYRGANFPNTLGADYLRTNITLNNAPQVVTTGNNAQVVQQQPAPPMFLQLYGVGQSNATNSAEHRFVFTPIGEWRFGTEFKVSQAITLHAGYTGMWLGSIARASTNTGYRTDKKSVQYAEPLDPTRPPSLAPVVTTSGTTPPNPWVVKTKEVEFNRIGPVDGGQEYVFTNGVDFGITVRY